MTERNFDAFMHLGTNKEKLEMNNWLEEQESETKPRKFSARVKDKEVKRIRTAPQRIEDARYEPNYKDLFGSMVQTGRITILFADTGCGKSLLATSIGSGVSKGDKIVMDQSSIGREINVLMYDCENSDQDFSNRYHRTELSPNLNIANSLVKTKYGDLDKSQLLADIEETQADLVIIDNITYSSLDSTTDTDASLKIMNVFVEVKKETGVAFLIVAHVPKIDPFSKLTLNSLGGSKMLSNFAESVIAMGKSIHSIDTRYIKHIKRRGSAESNEVLVYDLVSEEGNLHFQYTGISTEDEMIRKEAKYSNEMKEKAKEMKAKGISEAKISAELGVPPTTINNWMKGK